MGQTPRDDWSRKCGTFSKEVIKQGDFNRAFGFSPSRVLLPLMFDRCREWRRWIERRYELRR